MLRSTLCLCSGHPRLRHGLAKREELRSGCTGIVLSDTSQVSATKKSQQSGYLRSNNRRPENERDKAA